MVKFSDYKKEDIVCFVEQNAKFLTDLSNEKSKHTDSFYTLASAIHKEKAAYRTLGIQFVLANILNKDQKIKDFRYSDHTFKLLIIGSFENAYAIIEKISNSKAFFHFTDHSLLLPEIKCLNTMAKWSASYKTIIKHSIILLNA